MNNCPPYSQICLSLDNRLYSDPIFMALFVFFIVVELALSSLEQIQLKLKGPATSFWLG